MDQTSTGERDLFAPSPATLEGANADVYFRRSRQILEAESLDPQVVMEVFTRRPARLCGLGEVQALLQRLPGGLQAWAVPEGSSIKPGEVVLRLRGRYRAFGLYETAVLGMLSSGTGWATAAAECVAAAGEIPLICFGARHIHPDVSRRMEYAAMVAGFSGCATTDGALLGAVEPSGTIPHALVLCMGDTLVATRAFERHIEPEVRRIALVDTFADEAEESLRVARDLGPRLWGVRLDTPSERGGVTVELVAEVRARLDQAGHEHVRLVVSGGLSPERIRQFCRQRAPIDAFGVGSAVSGAPPIDFTADIKEVDGRPVAKRGRIPGLRPNPRLQPVDLETV